jgi:SAM-dependent methyltransferase
MGKGTTLMHPEARKGLARQLAASGLSLDAPWRVLDLGGRDINGQIRDLLPAAKWTGLDIEPGPGVDLVHDATQPWPDGWDRYDVVVCTEVLEHVEQWAALLRTASQALEPGRPELLLVTCASTGRPVHGASGAPLPEPGEWYANVPPQVLGERLLELFRDVTVEYRALPGDAYARAVGVVR